MEVTVVENQIQKKSKALQIADSIIEVIKGFKHHEVETALTIVNNKLLRSQAQSLFSLVDVVE